MMTYAGYPFTLLTDGMLPKVNRWWDRHAPDLWSYPGYNVDGMNHLPLPDRPSMPNRARLNVLYWPTGASRWGVFHGLMSSSVMAAVQSQCGGYGTPPVSRYLIIDDDKNVRSVTAAMYLIATRPVFTQGTNQLYWVTLVDARYFFWMRQLSFTFADGDSWDDLLLALAAAAGSPVPTIAGTISADYGDPYYARWALTGKPLPLLMDAAARMVGRRYVISLDGTTAEYTDYTTAQSVAQTQYDDYTSDIVIGGRLSSVPGGSPGTAQPIIGHVPANVSVSFWGDTPDIVNVSLASLALSEYSGLQGVTGKYGYIGADLPNTTVTPTEADYAEQAATDYYLWLLSLNDLTVRSVGVWESSGLEDRIEWEYVAEWTTEPTTKGIRWLTRIVPISWNENSNTYGGEAIGSSPPPPPPAVIPPFIRLTETTGPSSWQGREVTISSGVWANSADSGTNDARPFQMDGAEFTPKPTADALMFEDEDGEYGYLPIQAADKVSSTYYPGFVSTSAQAWNGNKTFGDGVYVNADGASSGTPFIVYDGGSLNSALAVNISSTEVSVGDGTIPFNLMVHGTAQIRQGMTVVAAYPAAGALVYPSGVGTKALKMGALNPADDVVIGPLAGAGGWVSLGPDGIVADQADFTTNCHASGYSSEDLAPMTYNGGTVSDGVGGYYFLNGLYIDGAGTGGPIFEIGGGSSGLTITGGTTSTIAGTLAIGNGGTGQTTANAGFNALAPSQGGNSGEFLTTDGTDTSWAALPSQFPAATGIGTLAYYNGAAWVALETSALTDGDYHLFLSVVGGVPTLSWAAYP